MALGGMDQLVGADWVTPYPSHSSISHLFLSTSKDASVSPCQKQNIVEDLCLHPPLRIFFLPIGERRLEKAVSVQCVSFVFFCLPGPAPLFWVCIPRGHPSIAHQ